MGTGWNLLHGIGQALSARVTRKRWTRSPAASDSDASSEQGVTVSSNDNGDKSDLTNRALNRRNILLAGTTLAAASAIASANPVRIAQAQQQPGSPSGNKPNIVVIMGDDIGYWNIGAYHQGCLLYTSPSPRD